MPQNFGATSDKWLPASRTVGQVLCFVSPKGGTGKTIISASTSFLLQNSGVRVLAIDADFSTRGLSLFLLGNILQSSEIFVAPLNCLADSVLEETPVDKVTPLSIVAGSYEHHVLISNRDVWRGGVPDERFLGGLPDRSERTSEITGITYFRYLRSLCERFRHEFDYVIIDTRGGYDFTTAVPAVVADGYVIVLEADSVSMDQVHGFRTKIEEFEKSLYAVGEQGINAFLKGFIVNKAIFPVDDRSFPEQLQRLYDAKTFGVIPADRDAIRAYQKKNLALETFPESDFSFYTVGAIEHVISPAHNWTNKEYRSVEENAVFETAKKRFDHISGRIRSRWLARRRVERVQELIPFCVLALLVMSTISYAAFKRGIAASLPVFYGLQTAVVIIAMVSATIASIAVTNRWKRRLVFKIGLLCVSLVLVVGMLFIAVNIPATFSRGAYAARVKAQDTLIAKLDTTNASLHSQLQDSQDKASFYLADKQRAEQALKSTQDRLTKALAALQATPSQQPPPKSDASAAANKDRAALQPVPPSELHADIKAITPDEARAFVKHVMSATEEGNLPEVMAGYAPQVDYYDKGVRDQKFIRSDQKNYLSRFTQRKYELGAIDIIKGNATDISKGEPDTIQVRFSYHYRVSGKIEGSGFASEIWVLRKNEGQIQIIDCKSDVQREKIPESRR